MRETVPTFRKKIGNTTYTVRVHFDQNSEETFEKKVRRLIINDCLQTAENGHFSENEKFHTTP
ncbi:MAG: transposon-encoded TnpW family protein [Lachnospiraceae bacterium]|nr:transposon-encoded TnpW family protein [Lachnospiraceae bacterium]